MSEGWSILKSSWRRGMGLAGKIKAERIFRHL